MPEMQIIEWKEIWKDDYLAWICGFANAQGGTLYIGKNDNGETEYIEISVQPYPIAISYKGVYYYRSGSTNQKLTGLELESFLLRKQGATWDNLPLPSFTISDIDNGVVKRFIKWAAKKGCIDESAFDEQKETLIKKHCRFY